MKISNMSRRSAKHNILGCLLQQVVVSFCMVFLLCGVLGCSLSADIARVSHVPIDLDDQVEAEAGLMRAQGVFDKLHGAWQFRPDVVSTFVWPEFNSNLLYVQAYGVEPILSHVVEKVRWLSGESDRLWKQSLELDKEYAWELQTKARYEELSCGTHMLAPECDELEEYMPIVDKFLEERSTELYAILGQRAVLGEQVASFLDEDTSRPQNYLHSASKRGAITIRHSEEGEVRLNFRGFGPYQVNYSSRRGDFQDVVFDSQNHYLEFTVLEKIPKDQKEVFADQEGASCLGLASGSRWLQTCRAYHFLLEMNPFLQSVRVSGEVLLKKRGQVIRRGSVQWDGVPQEI